MALTGLIRGLITKRNLTAQDWLIRALGGRETYTGRQIGANDALASSAVFACVRILAETVGSLPLHVYRRLAGGGKETDPSHRLYPLLHDAPNPEMTSMEFREAIVGHLALRGNAYAEIERDAGARPIALWPLRPDRMDVRRDLVTRRLIYRYELPNSTLVLIDPANLMHLRGLSADGVIGYSPIALLREPIAFALALEEYGARLFGNNASPGGVLSVQKPLSATARKNLKDSWEEYHRGLSNAHRVAVLEEGVSWQAIGIAPEDAQFLETRKFQTAEIARIFRIPPHLIGDLEKATFSNIEQQSLEFVIHTIRPWLVRIEQAIKRDLFRGETGQRTHFAEFKVDGLLRGDLLSRYQAYTQAHLNGWMTANEIRDLENLNPLPGGDDLLIPLNVAPVGQVAAGTMQPAAAGG